MSLLSKLFSKTQSAQELQDKLKEIDLEQRKKRRDLAMLEEAKQQKVKRAVEAKKAGRQALLRHIFRDVSQIEINIGNATSDLRRLSLTRTALSSFVRKAEMLEKKKDRKSLQKLVARFNDSSIQKVIDSASVDDDTFNSMLEDVLGEEEVSAAQSKVKEDTGFADFDRAISDMSKAEDAGAGDEDLTGLRQEAHKPAAIAATRTTKLRTMNADAEVLRGRQAQRIMDEDEEALRDKLSQMKNAMDAMQKDTNDMRHDSYSAPDASRDTNLATAKLGPHPTGLMDSISGVIAPALGSSGLAIPSMDLPISDNTTKQLSDALGEVQKALDSMDISAAASSADPGTLSRRGDPQPSAQLSAGERAFVTQKLQQIRDLKQKLDAIQQYEQAQARQSTQGVRTGIQIRLKMSRRTLIRKMKKRKWTKPGGGCGCRSRFLNSRPNSALSVSKAIPMHLPISLASPWERSCRWAAARPPLCRLTA